VDNQSNLELELEQVRNLEKRLGWLNSSAQYSVATLALVGSVGASLLAAFEAPKVLTAVVAAIPAAVAAVTRIFPFEARALAHWRKEYRLHGLLSKLRYEGVDPKAISQEFREIESTTFDGWPLLAPAPGEVRKPSTDRPGAERGRL